MAQYICQSYQGHIEENEVFPAIFPHDTSILGSSLTPRFQMGKSIQNYDNTNINNIQALKET